MPTYEMEDYQMTEINKNCNEDIEVYTVKESQDPNFINDDEIYKTVTGGQNYLATSQTHKCNCGCFKSKVPGLTANYCDNCQHARISVDNPPRICCSLQPSAAMTSI